MISATLPARKENTRTCGGYTDEKANPARAVIQRYCERKSAVDPPIFALSVRNSIVKHMLIVLYGPDSYRRQAKLKEYLVRYQTKFGGVSLRSFDFADTDEYAAFKEFVKAQSLFEESRLGIVRGLAELSDSDRKELKGILKDQME